MRPQYLELNEELHLYLRDGKPLFAGTPDRKLIFPKENVTVVIDRKCGRLEVPPADCNMQLRGYLTMTPAFEFESEVPYGYSAEFRPSSLLRFKECPGALALERSMRAKGLSGDEPSEDAAEGQRLHKAISEPLSPRDDLSPEQLDTVEKAERMEEEFIDFVLGCDPMMPFYGAIVQPRTSKKADAAFYTEEDIVSAKAEIDGIWDAANQPGAPRKASQEVCRFCPCKVLCPEYKAWVGEIEKISHMPAAQWNAQQWDVFLSRRGELEKFIEARLKDAKRILAAVPDAIPGWELVPGDEVRHCADLPAAWAALAGIVSAKDFSASCKMSFGDLEEIIYNARKNTGNKMTQKEVKSLVNVTLHGLIQLKAKGPSLRKKKDA